MLAKLIFYSLLTQFNLHPLPYGIETERYEILVESARNLLIVPYGIETVDIAIWRRNTRLLIVPYGIETISVPSDSSSVYPFNRTLWN